METRSLIRVLSSPRVSSRSFQLRDFSSSFPFCFCFFFSIRQSVEFSVQNPRCQASSLTPSRLRIIETHSIHIVIYKHSSIERHDEEMPPPPLFFSSRGRDKGEGERSPRAPMGLLQPSMCPKRVYPCTGDSLFHVTGQRPRKPTTAEGSVENLCHGRGGGSGRREERGGRSSPPRFGQFSRHVVCV